MKRNYCSSSLYIITHVWQKHQHACTSPMLNMDMHAGTEEKHLLLFVGNPKNKRKCILVYIYSIFP